MCEGFLMNAYKLGLYGAYNGVNRDAGAGVWHDWICLRTMTVMITQVDY